MASLVGKEIPCCAVLKGHTGPVLCLSFDCQGKTLCTGSDDGELRMWRMVNGSWQCVKTIEAGSSVTSCAFPAETASLGDLLCTGSGDNAVRLWRALQGECAKVLTGHKDRVNAVHFSPVGDKLVSGSQDGTAKLWQISGKEIKTIKGTDPILCVSFNPNGEMFATGSQEGVLKVYNAQTYALIFTCEGHEAAVHCLTFHPKTEWILTGSGDKMVRVLRETDGRGRSAMSFLSRNRGST
jgi:WD40 repeat protein